MRVNVTYSVELDEVRQLVEELLLRAEDNVENIVKLFPQMQNFMQNDNEKKAVELIEECRANLGTLDHFLFDCRNILVGYQQASLQLKELQQPVPEENESEHSDVENR